MTSEPNDTAGVNTERLPVDSDVDADETPSRAPRPIHLHWRYIGLVFVGGTIGTCARYLLSVAIPPWNGLPVAIFLINMSGAFLLGWLLEALSRGGTDVGLRRNIRLFVGTGILGGYTTYSTFALDTDGLIASEHFGGSILYGLGTIIIGAAASVAGIAVGAAIHRARAKGRER